MKRVILWSARSVAARVPLPPGYRKTIRRCHPKGFVQERNGFVRERNIGCRTRRYVFVLRLRRLLHVRAGLRFNPGANVVPNYLGDPNDLENSEDCRSVGGHGNQHVRLRRAQIDGIKAICPAPATICCFEPWQASRSPFKAARFSDFHPIEAPPSAKLAIAAAAFLRLKPCRPRGNLANQQHSHKLNLARRSRDQSFRLLAAGARIVIG